MILKILSSDIISTFLIYIFFIHCERVRQQERSGRREWELKREQSSTGTVRNGNGNGTERNSQGTARDGNDQNVSGIDNGNCSVTEW